jgi:peptide/nickel transport system substrate-binding protein
MISTKIDRRHLIAGMAGLPLGLAMVRSAGAAQETIEELVIDLPGPPESIDPALAYSPRDWSIVHSIYDSLILFDENGELVPLAAESFTTTDATTFAVTLRSGLTFHDGSPVTADAIARSIEYVKSSESYAVDLFTTIERVEVIDELNASIVCSSPSPWLAAQIAVWVLLIPEGFTADSAANAPVGSGPYMFESHDPGNEIVLVRNVDYDWESPKGVAMAERVVYRFVPEATTRVADLASDSAQIVTEIPFDQEGAVVDAGSTLKTEPIVGIGFIRIPNDVEPFVDVRVRQAMNHAVDLQAIATALLGNEVKRIATVYPDDRALGFDADLDPYDFDDEKARELLADAGYPDGFSTQLEVTSAARVDVAEAIIDQLGEVGIKVELVSSDLATFNAGWTDPERPALRMVTWSPLFEPYTFLSFIFVTGGFLSRYSNGEVDAAFAAASAEADPEARAEHLQEVGRFLHEDPAAIYLWNLVTSYGIGKDAEAWTPRGDEYVIATSVSE